MNAFKTFFITSCGVEICKSVHAQPMVAANRAMKKAKKEGFDTLIAYNQKGEFLLDLSEVLNKDFSKMSVKSVMQML